MQPRAQGTDNTHETYQNTKVEGFGLHMLNMMGADPEVLRHEKTFVAVPRNHRMGLGADSIQPNKEEQPLSIGEQVVVVDGKHHGQEGVVARLRDKGTLRLELASGVHIKVAAKQVVRCSQLKGKGVSRERSREKDKPQKRLEWVTTNIRVKVVDSARKDLYLKKVVVSDVLDAYSFQCRSAESVLVDDLNEDQVQTVVPKLEQQVLVVQGDLQGQLAVLKEKQAHHMVWVQLVDSLEFMSMHSNQVSEYVAPE